MQARITPRLRDYAARAVAVSHSGVGASLRRYARCRRAGMEDFVKHFCRDVDGSWTCTSSATLSGPNGRIQVAQGSRFYPGTSFMGFDLAKWLDEQVGGRAGPC